MNAVLLLLAAAGMGMMISANDLISLYMGIELQSLALYVVAAINRDSLRSTEAGLNILSQRFVIGYVALRRVSDLRLFRLDQF